MKAALLVEDLPGVRDWLAETLQAAFPLLEITTADNRAQALERVAQNSFDLALVDLGLPDGSGLDVVRALRDQQPAALSVVVTIYDDDAHLFPALQAGAFGYLLKEQPRNELIVQLLRIAKGEPPLSPAIARRVLGYFSAGRAVDDRPVGEDVRLTGRETDVLQRIAKGYTLPEIALQFGLSRHTVGDYLKQVYRKLNVSSRAEATLEAARRGLVKP